MKLTVDLYAETYVDLTASYSQTFVWNTNKWFLCVTTTTTTKCKYCFQTGLYLQIYWAEAGFLNKN